LAQGAEELMQVEGLVGQILLMVSQAAVLGIATLGLALIYRVYGVINLAHGQLVALGAYLAFVLAGASLPPMLAVPVAFVLVGALGWGMELVLLRRLWTRPIDCMIATLAVGVMLSQLLALIFGAAPLSVAQPLGQLHLGSALVPWYGLVLVPVALVLFLGLHLLLKRTPPGIQAMAAAQEPEIASTLGVDVAQMRTASFALGSALAGAAGALLAPLYIIEPLLQTHFGLWTFATALASGPAVVAGTALAAAVLGGSQSIFGSLVSTGWGELSLVVVSLILLRFWRSGFSIGRKWNA